MPVLAAAWRGHTGGVGGELLVGRRDELAVLLDTVGGDGPPYAVLTAGPGMGKTSVLAALLARAGDRDVRILHAAPTELERVSRLLCARRPAGHLRRGRARRAAGPAAHGPASRPAAGGVTRRHRPAGRGGGLPHRAGQPGAGAAAGAGHRRRALAGRRHDPGPGPRAAAFDRPADPGRGRDPAGRSQRRRLAAHPPGGRGWTWCWAPCAPTSWGPWCATRPAPRWTGPRCLVWPRRARATPCSRSRWRSGAAIPPTGRTFDELLSRRLGVLPRETRSTLLTAALAGTPTLDVVARGPVHDARRRGGRPRTRGPGRTGLGAGPDPVRPPALRERSDGGVERGRGLRCPRGPHRGRRR